MTGRSRHRGILVAVEGIDGTGKSTLVRSLAREIRRRGASVALHREPSDPRLGRLAQEASVRDPWTGAVYFTVDRHLAAGALRRALRQADVVLSDRSYFSTLAYQGSALPASDRQRLERIQLESTVRPDRVLLVDLPVEEALDRVGRRSERRAPLERRRTLARVARAYRRLARAPGWVVLDGRRPPRELVADALRALGFDRPPSERRAGRGRR